MTELAQAYHSESLAAGYAFDRPPVHQHIVQAFGGGRSFTRVLDIGCGAGLSTAAIMPLAQTVVGLEPAQAMLAHRATIAPGAHFVVGRAEELPFTANTFDLITAAGALNYVDPARFFAEAARVLTEDGRIVVYDFGQGSSEELSAWLDELERRHPALPGYAMDVTSLGPLSYEALDIVISMTFDGYLRYALTENQNADPVWCRDTLREVFNGNEIEVVFPAYYAEFAA